jgi:hypothetical protein
MGPSLPAQRGGGGNGILALKLEKTAPGHPPLGAKKKPAIVDAKMMHFFLGQKM